MRKVLNGARTLEFICTLLACPLLLFPQQTSNTTGPCSPIASFNQGVIEIRCTVSSGKQADQLIEMVNKIFENQMDPSKLIEEQQMRDACTNSLAVLQATDRRVQILAKWLVPPEGQEELNNIRVGLHATMLEFSNPSDAVQAQKDKKSTPQK